MRQLALGGLAGISASLAVRAAALGYDAFDTGALGLLTGLLLVGFMKVRGSHA